MLRFLALVAWSAALPCAAASSLSFDTQYSPEHRYAYGTPGLGVYGPVLSPRLSYDGPACPGGFVYPPLQGTLSVIVDGTTRLTNERFYRSFYRTCTNGRWTAGTEVFLPLLDMGTHQVIAEYSGEPGIEGARSDPVTIRVVPNFSVAAPNAMGTVGIGVAPVQASVGTIDWSPGQVSFSITPQAQSPSAPPSELRFPYGFLNYRIATGYECGYLCPPFPPTRVQQRLQLQFPDRLPSNATIWVHAPNNQDPSPAWKQVPARIDGRLATFTLEGGLVDSSRVHDDYVMRGTLAVSIPASLSGDSDWKGMWWGGPAENGWGLSLSQETDRLFGVLYVYDDAGKPLWLAMGNGRWDPAKSAYQAQLYRPLSPTGDGQVVGTVALSSQTPGVAMLEYRIGGVSGMKMITKMDSNVAAEARIYAGAWDEVPLGGGVTIDGSGDSLFIGWPTFLSGEDATWLLVPGGSWTAANTYEGAVYRTKGSRWVGPVYDANALEVAAAGSMKIVFTDADHATLTYSVDGQSGTRSIVRKRF